MVTLAEKYRPKDIEEVSGAPLVCMMLKNMVALHTLPSCLLLYGPRGTGKTSTAKILAWMLNDGDPGNALIERDAATHNGVDDIRKLQEEVRYAHNNYRVVVLDEVHSLSSQAFNALLKILETPPKNTIFVLVTTHPEAIPETVRDRAMAFRFPPLSVPNIARRIAAIAAEEGMAIDAHVLLRIAEVSDGSLRYALVLLQQLSYLDNPTVDTVNQLTGRTIDFTHLIYAMLEGSLTKYTVEVESIFTDTHDPEILTRGMFDAFKVFFDTGDLSGKQFLTASEMIWSMRSVSRAHEVNTRTLLEAGMFALFAKVFWNGEEEITGSSVKALTPLTQADIDKLR